MTETFETSNGFIAEFTDEYIKGFFGPYRFLSNYHLTPIEYEGVIYPSTENAYQASKTSNILERVGMELLSPAQAKAMGNDPTKITIRDGWADIKENIMLFLLREKFYKSMELAYKLKATEQRYLEETNYWMDIGWGVCNGVGENKLGLLLMKVRDELSTVSIM